MLIKGASQVPGGFGNRKYFLVFSHSTKNMLLTVEMPFRNMVQFGSTLDLGSRGRRFKSGYSDFMRAYPRGEGIRLISVNATGSSPVARIFPYSKETYTC